MKKTIILWCGVLIFAYALFSCISKPKEQLENVETVKTNSLKKVSKLRYGDKN